MKREVVKAHEEIFGEDPFLMSEKKQNDYSEAIVRYLLLYRTRKTTKALPVDLFADDLNRVAPPSALPPRPTEAEAGHYREARANRRKVADESVFKSLKDVTIISNGAHTRRRREEDGREEGRYAPHDVAEKDLNSRPQARNPDFSTLDRRLRVAVVGYRVMVSLVPNAAYLDEDLCIFLPPSEIEVLEELPERDWLVPLGRTREARHSEDWQNALKTHIARARKRGSHVTMLPEFALPPVRAKGESQFEQSLLVDAADPAITDHFLLAGTRHEGSTNRALVMAKQNGKVSKFRPQHKIASARNMGENVLGPRETTFPSYTVTFHIPDREPLKVTIMVAICYDAFDPAVFLKLCHAGAKIYNDRDSDFLTILIPSFNKSEDFVALLRDLSFLTRSLVIYGDSLNGNAKLFYCGFALSDLYDDRTKLEDKLNNAVNDLVNKYDAYRQKRQDDANRNQLTPEAARSAVSRMRHKRDTSISLQGNLHVLRSLGALDHLVTVEPLAEPPSTNPRLIDDDLLYYNLDVRLLDLLKTFREDYFLNDDFLPRALQLDELGGLSDKSPTRSTATHADEEQD